MSGFFKKPHPDPLLLGEETENLLLIGGGGEAGGGLRKIPTLSGRTLSISNKIV